MRLRDRDYDNTRVGWPNEIAWKRLMHHTVDISEVDPMPIVLDWVIEFQMSETEEQS